MTTDAIIDYLELPAVDLTATKRFYQEAFGWEWVDYGPTYAASSTAGPEVALSIEATTAPAHSPNAQSAIGPLVLFSTSDLDATLERITAAGGTIVSEAYAYPGGRRFHFHDPSGNTLGVYQSASGDAG